MTPAPFPEANTRFGPPQDLTDAQCLPVMAYVGQVRGGSVDGYPVIVTAWRPDARELEVLKAGGAVYLSFASDGLPPHFLTTSFEEATHPA